MLHVVRNASWMAPLHDACMRTLTALLLTGGVLGATGAAARDPLESTAILEVGWFFLSTDIRVRADGEAGDVSGTDIDYDDTFAVGDFDRLRAEASWRMATRHLLRGMYFENNRAATNSLDRDIVFDGRTYPAHASTAARSQITVAQLSYEYAFLRGSAYEVAGGIGVHFMDMKLSLAATLVGSMNSRAVDIDESASTAAPLPVIGVRGTWRLPHDFYITGQVQYFHLDVDPYSGSLLDLKAALVWQFSDHMGVGVAYNDFGFRFDIEGAGDFDGRLRVGYGGTIAYATFMF